MNQKRFHALYELHRDSLISYASFSLHDPQLAEDMVQDAFLLFAEHVHSCSFCSEQSKQSSLLFYILHTLVERSNQNADTPVLLPYEEDFSVSSDQISLLANQPLSFFLSQKHLKKTYSTHTKRILQSLPPHERFPLILSAVYRLSSAEIAAILSIQPATVRKRLQRARTHFAEKYHQD